MAHEFESGFFVRQPAWHRLGTVVDKAPSTREAIALAGLDWRVEAQPVYLTDLPDGDTGGICHGAPIPGYRAQTRSDTGAVLGVTTDKFRALQNSEAFAFFDSFLHEGDCSLEAAGSLKGGKVVWVLAKINVDADVGASDPLSAYFLLSNGHGGNLKLRVQFTPIRVVCWNTLSASLARAEERHVESIVLRHTRNVAESLMAVRETVDLAKRTFALSVDSFRAMAARGLDVAGFRQYVREVFDLTTHKKDGELPPMPRCFEELERYFDGGAPGARTAGHTLWGAYNAVTEWVDHSRGRSDENRLHASWFGEGANIRTRAADAALAAI